VGVTCRGGGALRVSPAIAAPPVSTVAVSAAASASSSRFAGSVDFGVSGVVMKAPFGPPRT
jgi:hypothetical protein